MADYEDRDARVVRRWREKNLNRNPPQNITNEEAVYAERMMQDWKPKPYVHTHDDIIYQDDDATYPWARPGWDPKAAMSSSYVVPHESAFGPVTVPDPDAGFVGDTDLVKTDVAAAPSPATVKSEPTWVEPSRGEKARVTALTAARWTVAEMASLLEMSEAQFRWAFHDTMQTATLAMRARLTTAVFADAIAAPGAARSRVADVMGVFKETPARPSAPPVAKSSSSPAAASVAQRLRKLRKSRFGGPPPKPGPDGLIPIGMVLGDTEAQARWDAEAQKTARRNELINDYRASKTLLAAT